MATCTILVNHAFRHEFLDLCIASYCCQTFLDFEVVVAEDGETREAQAVIAERQREAPFPIRYVGQKRLGHRRALILNRGIAAAETDYILFTDCDSLAPKGLVDTHMRYREEGRMLVGGRIKMTKDQTNGLTIEDVTSGNFENVCTRMERLALRLQHWKNVWYILTKRKRRPHNYGMNMSVSRKALEKVNGYDNRILGWGNADGDLRERLKMANVWPKSIWCQAVVFHQRHPQQERHPGNREYAMRKNTPMVAEDGLRQAVPDRD